MPIADEIMLDDAAIFEEDFLDYAESRGFGDLHFKVDPKTGMRAIIAIHNTKLGPALGGCRFIEYNNSMSALRDAMRLARGMSYKSALVDLPLGGGKSVIIKPKGEFDREAYMHAFGEFVSEMNGRYITALDSGTELSDMDIISEHTPHVASLSRYDGDPSPYTGAGVLRGIEAAVKFKLGRDNLEGLHIAVQGLGHVGQRLCALLHERGAKLTVADVNQAAVQKVVEQYGATAISTNDIHKVKCDVFSPCAMGAVINDKTINELDTTIIAGAANNQLQNARHGRILHDRGILFAVDYVINAGGLIFAASKYFEEPTEQVEVKIDNIYNSLLEIFGQSQFSDVPTSEIADSLAKAKIA